MGVCSRATTTPLQTEDYAQALAQARRPGSFGPAQREEHRRRACSPHTGGPENTLIVNETTLRAMPCPAGAFRLLEFSPSHRLAHLPAPCGPGQLATTPAEASDYAALFTALAAAALPREDSAALLERLLREQSSSPPALPPATAPEPTAPEASRHLASLASHT